jgi:hypothetical protein
MKLTNETWTTLDIDKYDSYEIDGNSLQFQNAEELINKIMHVCALKNLYPDEVGITYDDQGMSLVFLKKKNVKNSNS